MPAPSLSFITPFSWRSRSARASFVVSLGTAICILELFELPQPVRAIAVRTRAQEPMPRIFLLTFSWIYLLFIENYIYLEMMRD